MCPHIGKQMCGCTLVGGNVCSPVLMGFDGQMYVPKFDGTNGSSHI